MENNRVPQENKLQINLDGLIGNLQIKLQHLSDLILFSHTASSSAQEAEYNNSLAFFNFYPAHNQKLNFNQVKEKFKQWYLTASFKEAVDYLNCFLDECYLVCEILKSGQGNHIKGELFNWILNIGKRKFHKLGLPDKLKRLKNRYGVSSSMEEQIFSLNRVRNCLTHRLGVVIVQDVDVTNMLVVKFKQMNLFVMSPDHAQEIIISGPTHVEAGSYIGLRLNDYKKEFKLGECINFTEHEHVWSMFTFLWFASELKNSMCKVFNVPVKITGLGTER